MKRSLLFLTLLYLIVSCKNNSDSKNLEIAERETIPVYDFDEFEYMLYFEDEKTYVVNFWAT